MSRRVERAERAGGEHFLIMQSLTTDWSKGRDGRGGEGRDGAGKVLQLTRKQGVSPPMICSFNLMQGGKNYNKADSLL